MATKPPAPPKNPARPKRTAKPRRPANLPRGRWLGDFEPLSIVERQLVEHCARGARLTLGNDRPEKSLAGNKIRAGIIRFLLLGGDDQNAVHEEGVMVEGAWIENTLDLDQACCRARLVARACRFDKEVTAVGAKIPALELIGSSIPGLLADGIRVEGSVFLRENFTATGQVRMLGAEIDGDLDCSSGTFSNETGKALHADRIKVKGSVLLRENFTATGEVRMLGAEIGGALSCVGGTFSNKKGNALHADSIRAKGGVFLRENFTATGQVRLLGAEIGSDLDCNGGTFSNEKGTALHADGIKVRGSIFLSDKFTARGQVRMLGTEIGGVLSCIGGTFSNEKGTALHASRIKVKGGVFLGDSFTADGEVLMLGAQVDGDFDCSGGTFSNEKGYALNLAGANIRNVLFFRAGTFTGEVSLAPAFAGTLVDDRACYKNATLILDGFRYDRIIGPTGAGARIGWLKRQRQAHIGSDFRPQPWEQLIRVLRDMGHPAEAAQIAMAKQQALRDAGQIGLRQPNPAFSGWRLALDIRWSVFSNFLARRLHWFYGWIAGYGHRPARIVWRMALVCALCSLAYYAGRDWGLIGPTSPVIHLNPKLAQCGTGGDTGAIYWTSPDCPVPPEYSTFQPFFYSLDVLIPFVDLHQEADWGPVVTNRTGQTLWGGRALRWILWFEIIFGWIASVMFVAIVGRLVDKD